MLPKETDDEIIALLQQNADLTYKEIGRKLKISESTIRKKILTLRKQGIIRRRLADVDPLRMGYRSNAMLGVDVDPSKTIDIGKKLVEIPEARMVWNTSGENDFHVVVWTKDRESLTRIVNNVVAIEGVIRVTPNFAIERLK